MTTTTPEEYGPVHLIAPGGQNACGALDTPKLTLDASAQLRHVTCDACRATVAADAEGGTWWPSAEAQIEIQAAADSEGAIVAMVQKTPMRGTWSA